MNIFTWRSSDTAISGFLGRNPAICGFGVGFGLSMGQDVFNFVGLVPQFMVRKWGIPNMAIHYKLPYLPSALSFGPSNPNCLV
jgi:hypothetical protein